MSFECISIFILFMFSFIGDFFNKFLYSFSAYSLGQRERKSRNSFASRMKMHRLRCGSGRVHPHHLQQGSNVG